jgi:TonB family protein
MKESKKLLHHLAFFAILSLFAGTVWGQKPQMVGQERPGVVQDWESRIAVAREQLRAGEFKKAQEIADALVQEMLQTIESGPGAGPIMGDTLILRALGAAGRNDIQTALWDWNSARAVNPKLTEAELAAYGEVGETLRNAAAEQALPQKSETDSKAAVKSEEKVTRPKKIAGEPPPYPRALRTACIEGVAAVEVIIDPAGHIRAPRLLQSPNPVLSLALLETLQSWRFKPGVYQGKPVAVYYTLTVNFQTRTCGNPAAIAAKKGKKSR